MFRQIANVKMQSFTIAKFISHYISPARSKSNLGRTVGSCNKGQIQGYTNLSMIKMYYTLVQCGTNTTVQ